MIKMAGVVCIPVSVTVYRKLVNGRRDCGDGIIRICFYLLKMFL